MRERERVSEAEGVCTVREREWERVEKVERERAGGSIGKSGILSRNFFPRLTKPKKSNH